MPKMTTGVVTVQPKVRAPGGAGITVIAGVDPKVTGFKATVKTVCPRCGGCGCWRCTDGWVEKPWVEEGL